MAISIASKTSAAPAPQRVTPSSQGTSASSATQGSSKPQLTSALHKDGFAAASTKFGIGALARLRAGQVGAGEPGAGMTDQSLNRVIDQGWKSGTLTPTNAIRAHFAANQMLGLKPWQHTKEPAQQIGAEQLRDGLNKTAGTSTGDPAAPKVSDQQLNAAVEYVNGARDASDQRRRITKALEGLFVESQRGADKGGAEPVSDHPPLGEVRIAAQTQSLRRGIYTPGTSTPKPKPSPVDTTPDGIIVPPST